MIDKTKKHIYQNELKTNLNLKHLKIIQQILESNNFRDEFFNKIKYLSDLTSLGENGDLIESLLSKHLYENKDVKNLLLSQSDIKHITDIEVDFIINNNFFQLKTINLETKKQKNKKTKKTKTFQFKLLSKSGFTKNSFSKEIYNSKICNTLILIYSKKKKEINSYFLTYNNLLIKNVNQYKNKKYYISPGITYCYDKNRITYINMSKKIKKNKQYLLSNQIEKVEKQLAIKNLIFEISKLIK